MGMSNDEIGAMIAGGSMPEVGENKKVKKVQKKNPDAVSPEVTAEVEVDSNLLISQDDVDGLLASFVCDSQTTNNKISLLEEIHSAILDSGRLTLPQWMNLRKKLSEIEALIPHIDLIIRLKGKKERAAMELS